MSGAWDVVVIGAGTAGAAAGLHCARQGLRTLVLDRGDLDTAGARWVNGVARAAFLEADVGVPEPPELRGEGEPMHLVAGWDGPLMAVDHDVLEVDMRLLGARLRAMAREAGAELRGGVAVRGWHDRDAGRLDTSAGPLEAQYVVDASGLKSVGLTPDDLARLLRAGLMDPVTSRAALEQRLPPVTPGIALGKAIGALRAPRRALGFLPLLPAMARVRRLYARYPHDPADLPAWGARVARLFGE